MAERTGTVTKVELPEEGSKAPAKITIQLEDGAERKITAWRSIPKGDEWVDNSAASVGVGDYGTFTGESKQESYQGNSFTRFYADGFTPKTKMNGSTSQAEPSQAQPNQQSPTSRSQENKDASFALSYAKDICVALVEAQHLTVDDVKGIWFSLADEASQWLRQQNS